MALTLVVGRDPPPPRPTYTAPLTKTWGGAKRYSSLSNGVMPARPHLHGADQVQEGKQKLGSFHKADSNKQASSSVQGKEKGKQAMSQTDFRHG